MPSRLESAATVGPRAPAVELPVRCQVMGIVNVTPDSFSDGGLYATAESAIARGRQLSADGADWVDVGGESTRPGAGRVAPAEELRRVLPVIRELAAAGIAVSVDTTRARVAAAAVDAGARLVNDVSGGRADPAMSRVVRDAGVRWVLTHSRGPSRDMGDRAHYRDVVAEVGCELLRRADDATAAGVDPARLILDPGLGFAKRAEHDWALVAGLAELLDLGAPLLIGASRKRFLSSMGSVTHAHRDVATLAITTLAARAGVWGVRVHDAASSAEAVRAVARLDSSGRLTGSPTGPMAGADPSRSAACPAAT